MISDETRSAGPGVLGGVLILDPATRQPITPGRFVLVDPESGEPYKAGVTVQQVEGGFDPTGLSTEQKQDAILSALQELIDAFGANTTQEVVITDDQLPPVEGQATATKQDQILSALNTLASLATEAATFRDGGVQAVSLESTPLPVGAASAAKQDQVLVALASLAEALSGTLNVAGTVALDPDQVTVSGTVGISNQSIAVTPAPGATYPVTIDGAATAAKQDAINARLAEILTALGTPQPITDNGGSITVDGNVGVSGAVQVEDNGKSLTVDGAVDAKQSGAWNVGITGTPTVNVGNTITISDGSGPLTVDGTVAATQSGSWTTASTQSGTWNVGITGTPSVNATPTGAATLSTTPTAISVGTTSVQLAAAQTSRRSLVVQNMGTTPLYLSFAATASATTPTFQVQANGWITIDRETWTGVVTAIRASGAATAAAVVTVTA